jgi:Ca2+-binding EF-hand superfamily protein
MTTITTITLTTFFTSLVLFAQETQRPAGGRLAERFKQLDRNGDGKLSAEEFPGAQFKQMDKDGDGFATMEELRASLGDRGPVRPAAEQPARTAPRIVWQVSIGGKSDLPKEAWGQND